MPHCSNCQTEVEINDESCPNCGAEFSDHAGSSQLSTFLIPIAVISAIITAVPIISSIGTDWSPHTANYLFPLIWLLVAGAVKLDPKKFMIFVKSVFVSIGSISIISGVLYRLGRTNEGFIWETLWLLSVSNPLVILWQQLGIISLRSYAYIISGILMMVVGIYVHINPHLFENN